MTREYLIKRKLLKFQDNSKGEGSYFVTLPKLWIESENLKKGDPLNLTFGTVIKICSVKKQ